MSLRLYLCRNLGSAITPPPRQSFTRRLGRRGRRILLTGAHITFEVVLDRNHCAPAAFCQHCRHRGTCHPDTYHSSYLPISLPLSLHNWARCWQRGTENRQKEQGFKQFNCVGETLICSSPTNWYALPKYIRFLAAVRRAIISECECLLRSIARHICLTFQPLESRYQRAPSNTSSPERHLRFPISPTADFWHCNMDSLTTHPSTAQQAKAFTSPASLSFPGGAGDLTPPQSEKDGQMVNGSQQGTNTSQPGTGVTPTTPAATPGAAGQGGVSGIVPTLQ